MGRGGHNKDRSGGPERKCIASGEVRPVAELVRFVVGPDQVVLPDITGRLPGRGIWVTSHRAALEKAVSKGLFKRAAKMAVTVPEHLVDQVEGQLAHRVIGLISLARKGGNATTGYERVRDWLQKDEAEVLIQASDGSERGKSKLSTPYGGSFIGWLTSTELGQAFGRESAVHSALRAGGLAQRVVEEAARLKGLRVSHDDNGHRKGKK